MPGLLFNPKVLQKVPLPPDLAQYLGVELAQIELSNPIKPLPTHFLRECVKMPKLMSHPSGF